MSGKQKKKEIKDKNKRKLEKQVARTQLLKHLLPLVYAVVAWVIVMFVLHLHAIRDDVFQFFIKFTVDSVVFLGKITFLPIESRVVPYITVAGYTMIVIMECTAYNFYVFVISLSLFSPVSWKHRLITLGIFIPSVYLLNSLRFITMGYIGKYYPQQFENIHDYLWNILFGFLIFLIWVWRYQGMVGLRKSLEVADESTA